MIEVVIGAGLGTLWLVTGVMAYWFGKDMAVNDHEWLRRWFAVNVEEAAKLAHLLTEEDVERLDAQACYINK